MGEQCGSGNGVWFPGIEPLELNLSEPHRISAAAAKTGGGSDAPGLLKLPRKAQLRTSLCLQVSGVRRPKARHGWRRVTMVGGCNKRGGGGGGWGSNGEAEMVCGVSFIVLY